MLKKSWGGIKSITTVKFIDKTTRNLLMVNENVIANKNWLAEIFNDLFWLMLVLILHLEYQIEKDLLKDI